MAATPFPISITGVIARVCKNQQALAWIEAWRDVWEPRGNTCHAALQHFALHTWRAPRQLWPQGLDASRPVDPWGPSYGAYGAWIAPLLSEPLWAHIEVVASELMLYDLERNVAGTLDLTAALPRWQPRHRRPQKPLGGRPQIRHQGPAGGRHGHGRTAL